MQKNHRFILRLSHHALAPDYNIHPEALCGMAENYIKEKQPTLLVVCFDNPDHGGIEKGHGGKTMQEMALA